MTITGRTSGQPRTTPVAIIEHDGRRWIWAPWGDVHWVRNLRAAGRATITVRRREEEVTATELDRAEREAFFRDVLGPVARSPPAGRGSSGPSTGSTSPTRSRPRRAGPCSSCGPVP